MGLFGKKESTFDADQNKTLNEIVKSLNQMMKNQQVLIENGKIYWGWIKNLDERMKNIESRMLLNEKRDSEQAALFANLSRSASQTEGESNG